MGMTSLNESGVNYFLDTLCSKADHAFQFAYSCTLERDHAFKIVKEAYSELSNNLPAPGDGDSDLVPVLTKVWSNVDQAAGYKTTNNEHKVFKELFGKLSVDERAVLCLVDYLGFHLETCHMVIKKSSDDCAVLLSGARKKLLEAKF